MDAPLGVRCYEADTPMTEVVEELRERIGLARAWPKAVGLVNHAADEVAWAWHAGDQIFLGLSRGARLLGNMVPSLRPLRLMIGFASMPMPPADEPSTTVTPLTFNSVVATRWLAEIFAGIPDDCIWLLTPRDDRAVRRSLQFRCCQVACGGNWAPLLMSSTEGSILLSPLGMRAVGLIEASAVPADECGRRS